MTGYTLFLLYTKLELKQYLFSLIFFFFFLNRRRPVCQTEGNLSCNWEGQASRSAKCVANKASAAANPDTKDEIQRG